VQRGRKRGKDVFRPLSPEHPDDETFPGLLMVRTEGRIYFGNAQRIGDKMWQLLEDAKPRVLVIDFSAVIDLEYTALKGLIEAEQQLRAAGITSGSRHSIRQRVAWWSSRPWAPRSGASACASTSRTPWSATGGCPGRPPGLHRVARERGERLDRALDHRVVAHDVPLGRSPAAARSASTRARS